VRRDSRIFVAGHRGLVGSAIVRQLRARGFERILTQERRELDLEDQPGVFRFFATAQPEFVFLAAARVGGILANSTYPADFIRSNLTIQANVIEAARRAGVARLLFLGSSCIYPRNAPQPIREEYLLTGPLEPTNAPYAIAKIAGIVTCQSYNRQYGTEFVSVMPTNLYGPGDNFDLATGHVLPALIRKFHEAHESGAPSAAVWGSGTPRREFLHVDDMAGACVHVMTQPGLDPDQILNVGFGDDVSIAELADIVRQVVGFRGEVVFDATKPDGTPRKLLDVSRLRALGWAPKIPLRDGIRSTYEWYLANEARGGRAAGSAPAAGW
jgi:GDP-L-fucose synthase